MTLTLKIENFDTLGDGGPAFYTTDGRGFEIGRDPAMDWTLPDPNLFISGRHAEIRFERGAYMLVDVSRNGTFVNGAGIRVKSPYRLENGDRLQIGHYLVSVSLSDAAPRGVSAPPAYAPAPPAYAPPPPPAYGAGGPPGPGGGGYGGSFGAPPAGPFSASAASPFEAPAPAPSAADIWGTIGAPVAPRPLADPAPRRAADFSEQHIDLPQFAPPPPPPQAPRAPAAESFAGAALGASNPPVPQPAPPRSLPPGMDGAILRALAEGAGLPEGAFAQGDPLETAREIGRALRVATDELAALLQARAKAKQAVKSGNRTMLGIADNNPLKFIPTAPERMDAMFSQPKPGFQRGAEAVKSGFDDVKRHQYAVHSAIQPALARLIEDLSPESVEQKVTGSMLHSRKARAWEIFVERWDAKTRPYENGMLDLFLTYFAEAYDQIEQGGKK